VSEFATHQRPLFANLVLAEEVNHIPGKVQSALLEAMQECQITIGGRCCLKTLEILLEC